MSSKLVQAVREKKLRSRSRSKQKVNKVLTKDKIDFSLNILQEGLQIVYPSEKINTLLSQFTKLIEDPVTILNEVYQSKLPQKCLQHNNIQTLYCNNDEKILCAGCMYHSNTHKGHKVVPLTNVQDIIKINLKTGIGKIQQHLKICHKVIEKAGKNLEKAQKQYPLLMDQINTFFMEFHQLLVDRRNEQLKLISEIWNKLRYQNSTLKMEMNRVCTYVKNKLDCLKVRQQNEALAYNKNLIDTLGNIENIIDQGSIKIQQNPYFKEVKKMKIMFQLAKQSLVLNQVKPKGTQSPYKSPKSPKNKSTNLSKKNSLIQKSPKKQTLEQKSLQQKLIEMHEKELGIQKVVDTPKNIKNRHSTSQVLLKTQVQKRKRQYEKQQAKKLYLLNKSQGSPTSKQVKKSPDKKGFSKNTSKNK